MFFSLIFKKGQKWPNHFISGKPLKKDQMATMTQTSI
jgi:hypothetical protein